MNAHSAKLYLLALAIVIVVAVGLGVPGISSGQSEPDELTGYAWSETTGWLSMNCKNDDSCGTSNYRVEINPAGILSGFGWSENIGWVSANTSDVAGCPEAPCTPKVEGDKVVGWLKALGGGTESSGGWDGWIRLSGISGTGGAYGVKVGPNGTFLDCETEASCAWGDINIGWLDFSKARIGGPTANLTATPPEIPQGSFSFLYWDSTRATSCEGVGFETGGLTKGGPLQTKNLSKDTRYEVVCTDGVSDATDDAFVDVLAVSCDRPFRHCGYESLGQDPAQPYRRTFGAAPQCAFTDTPVGQRCARGCRNGTCITPPPQVDDPLFDVFPNLVRSESKVTVEWTAAWASCIVDGTNGDYWESEHEEASTRTELSSEIKGRTVYTIQCDVGAENERYTDSETVNIIPVFEER